MKPHIIPSIIAKNQTELELRLNKVRKHTKWIQLDAMDGKFVKNKSFNFNFKLPRFSRNKYELQLMVKNPKHWIEKHGKKVHIIIFHIESCRNEKEIRDIIKLIKSMRKKVGLAINPKTSVSKLKLFSKDVDMFLVMTVTPGGYGAKFLPETLKKVKQLRKSYPKLSIEVDGSINDKTISKAKKAGANRFVVGSYLQKADNVIKAVKVLKRKI
ncbi:MAG: ribulose-phosphate 3-epimerase [Candidatus Nanoarchaeia archaeon]